jgi:hypothetical protein
MNFNDVERIAMDCGFHAHEDMEDTTYFCGRDALAKFSVAIASLVQQSAAKIAEGYNFSTSDGKAIASIIRTGGQA